MAEPYHYGAVDPVEFKITLNGDGVTGLTLDNADLQLSIDRGAFANIGNEVTELGLGIYYWIPSSATQTQGETLILNLRDNVGAAFDENTIILKTGGDASGNGYFRGTR